jgi:hypothetical protein
MVYAYLSIKERRGKKMSKMFLILIFAFALCAMVEGAAGQQIYKWVDEKGTVHFSETPTSDVLKPQGNQNSKERSLEVVKGLEKTKEPSKEEALIEYRKQRDREQDAREEANRANQQRKLKETMDRKEEMRQEMQQRRGGI